MPSGRPQKMLRDMQDAYAVGDPSAMRGVVVEEVLTVRGPALRRGAPVAPARRVGLPLPSSPRSRAAPQTLKRGMRSRDSRAPERYAARIISFEEPASIVQYRQLPMSSTQVDMFHAQITVRMVPRYAVGIYSRHGDYLRDMTDLPEDLDLRSILPLLERSEAVPWRAARTSPLADPYFYRIDTQETTWTAPSIYIDQPSLYSGIGMAPPAQASAPAPAGEDPLGLAKAAPPKAAPLSLVRELFAVFDRPAFNSSDGWRIMLLYSAPSDGSPMPRYTSVTAAAGLADPKA